MAQLPFLLAAWLKLESLYYKESATEALSVLTATDRSFPVLYDGNAHLSALLSALIKHRLPTLTILSRGENNAGLRIIDSSVPDISDPHVLTRALSAVAARVTYLKERASVRAAQTPVPPEPPRARNAPVSLSTVDVLRFIALAVRYKIDGLLKAKTHRIDHWETVYRAENKAPVKFYPETDTLQADPFLWEDDKTGTVHIFYESMPYATMKGVIAHAAYTPETQTLGERTIVLDRPYHLSFPFLFSYDGEIYMIPETGQNGTIEIYKADPFPTTWTLHHIAMKDVIANDTALYHDGTLWWLFTSLGKKGQKNRDELSVFYAETPFSEWTPHPLNPVKSDCRSARTAGNLFRDDAGRLIRPAQDCTHGYGVAVKLCAVTTLTPTAYEETVVETIFPPEGYTGLHTVNETKHFKIFDVKSDKRLPEDPTHPETIVQRCKAFLLSLLRRVRRDGSAS